MRSIHILLCKDFIHFRRDRGRVILTFLVPFALIYLFGQINGMSRSGTGPASFPPTQFVAGWAMQFLLFALVSSATSLFAENDRGVFQRILSGSLPPSAILWSKFLSGVGLGLLQLLILFGAGSLLFAIKILPALPLLILVCVAAAASCSAFGMLLASVARTSETAQGLSTFCILMMAALGGAWFPVSVMPELMQHLSRFTLVYWSIRGFGQVLGDHASLRELLPTLGILAGISAALLAAAWWRFSRGQIFDPTVAERKSIRGPVAVTVLAVLALGAGWYLQPRGVRTDLSATERADDFDAAWELVRMQDCWLPQQPVDWNAAKALYRPGAIAAKTDRQFTAALEGLLDELYDAHTHLNRNSPDSWCLPPHDIWAEWRGPSVVVVDVRRNSGAARAGIEPGDEVAALNGIPLREQVAARLGHCQTRADAAAEQWALLSVLGGRHNETRVLTLQSLNRNEWERAIAPDPPSHPAAAFESWPLPSGIGYMHFTTFGDSRVVAEFDAALETMRGTRGLILDVRDNNGGSTDVGWAIAGRLIDHRTQFGWMARREGAGLSARWVSDIAPRGPWTYTQPVVVLVNHWSMSMAEQFAMALDASGRARTVGTPMAGLGAMVTEFELPHSRLPLQISERQIFALDGTRESDFRPTVTIALDRPEALKSADPYLAAGVAELRRMLASPAQTAGRPSGARLTLGGPPRSSVE
jgi:carboxyl-terminal processing protease